LKAAPDGAINTAERLMNANYRSRRPCFHSVHEDEGGPAAQTLPPHNATQNDPLPTELRERIRKLRLILLVISVSVLALNRQSAELDHDIASVLSQHACEPLDSEIERIESLLSSRACRRRQHEVGQ
jgi:hypothetical protein